MITAVQIINAWSGRLSEEKPRLRRQCVIFKVFNKYPAIVPQFNPSETQLYHIRSVLISLISLFLSSLLFI